MGLTEYRFVTWFVVAAAPQRVFEAVVDPEPWLTELRHVRRLRQVGEGDDGGVGRAFTTSVGTVPYRLRWRMDAVEVEPHVRLAWVATGDLAGRGTWTLEQVDAGTLVTSRWQVRTTKWWMRALTPVARPLFVHNHDRVMRAGAECLADHLGVALVQFHTADLAGSR